MNSLSPNSDEESRLAFNPLSPGNITRSMRNDEMKSGIISRLSRKKHHVYDFERYHRPNVAGRPFDTESAPTTFELLPTDLTQADLSVH
jgi:hypothetical protein